MNADTWKMRPHGVRTILALELKQRMTSKRWYAAMILWFILNAGIALLAFASVAFLAGEASIADGIYQSVAMFVFSVSVIFTIFALLLVLPAMSAGAINGDRTAGTLATLQASLISPAEIALGKILAGWMIGLLFIGLAAPVYSIVGLISGASLFYLVRVTVALAIVAFVIVALGVGFSSLTQRQLGSVVLTYLVVIGVTAILPVVYLMALPMAVGEREVTANRLQYESTADSDDRSVRSCERETSTETLPYSDVLAPLIYVNPVVFVSDAAPAVAPDPDSVSNEPERLDILMLVKEGVRFLGHPTHEFYQSNCGQVGQWDFTYYPGSSDEEIEMNAPLVYPPSFVHVILWDIVLWGGTTVGAFALTVYRLRTPMGRLPKGQRIA